MPMTKQELKQVAQQINVLLPDQDSEWRAVLGYVYALREWETATDDNDSVNADAPDTVPAN